MLLVFVFYCCVIPQSQELKTTQIYLTVSMSQVSRDSLVGFYPQILQGCNCDVSRGHSFHLGPKVLFQAHLSCQHSSVPYCYMSEILVFLLTIHWGLLSALRGCLSTQIVCNIVTICFFPLRPDGKAKKNKQQQQKTFAF